MNGPAGLLLIAAGVGVLLVTRLGRTGGRRPLLLASAAGVLACLMVLLLPFSLAALVYRDFGEGRDRVLLLALTVGPPVLAWALALTSLRLLRRRGRFVLLSGLTLAGVCTWLTLTGVLNVLPYG